MARLCESAQPCKLPSCLSQQGDVPSFFDTTDVPPFSHLCDVPPFLPIPHQPARRPPLFFPSARRAPLSRKDSVARRAAPKGGHVSHTHGKGGDVVRMARRGRGKGGSPAKKGGTSAFSQRGERLQGGFRTGPKRGARRWDFDQSLVRPPLSAKGGDVRQMSGGRPISATCPPSDVTPATCPPVFRFCQPA